MALQGQEEEPARAYRAAGAAHTLASSIPYSLLFTKKTEAQGSEENFLKPNSGLMTKSGVQAL